MAFLKRQSDVKKSIFGGKNDAMKIPTKLTEGLRYNLRMMNISIRKKYNILNDNRFFFISVQLNCNLGLDIINKGCD